MILKHKRNLIPSVLTLTLKKMVRMKRFISFFNFLIFLQDQYFTFDIILELSEYGCYIGSTVSIFLAYRLLEMVKWKITDLNFINLMLLLYYGFDSIMGLFEAFFLFKIWRER